MDYRKQFESIRLMALRGTSSDIDRIMAILDNSDLPLSRAVDFYLGHVAAGEGIARLSHYLFHGTVIQRNYCALFFERRNDWDLINRVFEAGLIDAIQAYSR